MGIGRKIVSVSAAAVLAGASLLGLSGQAHAVATITATSVDAGKASTITVSGCEDTATYMQDNATVVITDSTGKSITGATVQGGAGAFDATLNPGTYTATFHCFGYNGAPDSEAKATFTIYSTQMEFADTWTEGTPVTFTGEGLAPGETVSFVLTNSAGRVVFTARAAVTVAADGTFSYTVTFPDLPRDLYTLTATGDTSGTVRTARFSIGALPTTPPSNNGGNGLPSTGN